MGETLYDFAVKGVPKSAQAPSSSRAKWKKRVREAADSTGLPDDPPWYQDELSIVIAYYYPDAKTDLDVDNLAKPILDALVDLVYLDDRQVSQLTVRKTRLEPLLKIDSPASALAAALEAGGDFTYVAIRSAPNHAELPK